MNVKSRVYVVVSVCVVLLLSQSLQADPYLEGYTAAQGYDYNNAITHWGPLATEGYPEAQFNIALMYHGGLGVPFNEAEAVKWYHKSAEAGYTPAQEYLAAAYAEGWFGLDKDVKKADYWFSKVEEKQFGSAVD